MTSRAILLFFLVYLIRANAIETNTSLENSKTELPQKTAKSVAVSATVFAMAIGGLFGWIASQDVRKRYVVVHNSGPDDVLITCLEKDNNLGLKTVKKDENYQFDFPANFWGRSHFWCDVENMSRTRKLTFPVYGGSANRHKRNIFRVEDVKVYDRIGDSWLSFDSHVTRYERNSLSIKNYLGTIVYFYCKSNTKNEVEFSVEDGKEEIFFTNYVKSGESKEKWECRFSYDVHCSCFKSTATYCVRLYNKDLNHLGNYKLVLEKGKDYLNDDGNVQNHVMGINLTDCFKFN